MSAGKRLKASKSWLEHNTLLVVLSIIWGLAFVAIRRADLELSSVNLTLLRWTIVSGCYLLLYPFIVKPKARFETKSLPRLLVVSFASVAVYHLSLNYAEKTVSASLSGLLISLGPVFAVLLSSLSLHEKISGRLFLALVLALGGVAIVSIPDLDTGFASVVGPLAVVLSAFANGVFLVASKPLVSKYGPFPVAVWAALMGTAVMLPLFPADFLAQVSSLSVVGWLSVLYLSLLSTVAAYLIVYTLVGRQTVSGLSVQLYLVPLVSVVGGILLLGESISLLTIVGGGVLLLAVAVATGARS